ncbi:hypothetical protein A0256_22755 [Mucilaginibacter sp. PAMC 26640]|nr:hypothetical protein A0256_22755 [Mucilaginibacter sp. PAMC 26640]
MGDRSTINKTSIGRFSSIGSNVSTGIGTHPSKQFVASHPAFFSAEKHAGFSFVGETIFAEHIFIGAEKKHVVLIGNDVWIGNNCIIMDGVTVGDGAIIAAGAVVTKDVAPYSIVGGLPAKAIRLRFTPEQAAKLLAIKWWNWDVETIKAKSYLFTDIEKFIASANTVTT